ncbi:MAG: hypothetical protein AB7Y46_10140 [Armatimonadota bacterium]
MQVEETGAAGETQEETLSAEAVTQPIRSLMAALLAKAGVEPPVRVEAGELGPQLELSRLALNEVELVGVLRSITQGAIEREDSLPYALTLPAARHVYDVRAGAYLGQVDRIEGAALRGVAQLYALLPYRVTGLTIDGPATARAGEALEFALSLRTEGGAASAHVLHVDVQAPGETPGDRHWYARNLTTEGGRARFVLPLAANDPQGAWTITARDVISGQQATVTLTVGG